MGDITLNGEKLDVVIDRETGQELHDAIRAPRVRRPLVTKHNGNHSRSRSGSVRGLENVDPKTTHVIISGIQYMPAIKGPYTTSGESLLGALEYDENDQTVKCHECGEWFKRLAMHASVAHDSSRNYRIKHGFRMTTALATPDQVTFYKEKAAALSFGATKVIREKGNMRARPLIGAGKKEIRASRIAAGIPIFNTENANLKGKCQAQTLTALREYAAYLGRTPTQKELNSYTTADGQKPLDWTRMQRLFGVATRFVLLRAGLKVRNRGAQHGKRSGGPGVWSAERRAAHSARIKAKWAQGVYA